MSCIAKYIQEAPYEFDTIRIYYNFFVNSISSSVKQIEIMNRKRFYKNFDRLSTYDASEPEADFSKHYFYDLYAASVFYHTMLQNAACEQSARMNAMENASKNAGEILSKLTLQYNKARQARITMELVEIISGASAL